jgi:hypothetical protein
LTQLKTAFLREGIDITQRTRSQGSPDSSRIHFILDFALLCT